MSDKNTMSEKKNNSGHLTPRDTELAILAWRALKNPEVCEAIATSIYHPQASTPFAFLLISSRLVILPLVPTQVECLHRSLDIVPPAVSSSLDPSPDTRNRIAINTLPPRPPDTAVFTSSLCILKMKTHIIVLHGGHRVSNSSAP